MRCWVRVLLIVMVISLFILLIGPFLIPVPPLEGTVPPEHLADPDSRFIDINGLQVHYKVAGQGEPTLLLLHGFAASVFSWREVMEPLSEIGTVIAFDRPASGLTERPMPPFIPPAGGGDRGGEWVGESPYGAENQVELTIGLLDELEVERAILVGNSAGGTIAVLTALAYPQRVQALVLVDPAVYGHGGWMGIVRFLANTPQMQRIGPLLVRRIRSWGMDFGRSAWHDPSRITAEVWEGYLKPLRAENWDRGLWEMIRASDFHSLEEQLAEVRMPCLVITGDDDRIVPTEQSIRLADELPDADLVVIPDCGHIPHEECPEPFLQAVTDFLGKLPQN